MQRAGPNINFNLYFSGFYAESQHLRPVNPKSSSPASNPPEIPEKPENDQGNADLESHAFQESARQAESDEAKAYEEILAQSAEEAENKASEEEQKQLNEAIELSKSDASQGDFACKEDEEAAVARLIQKTLGEHLDAQKAFGAVADNDCKLIEEVTRRSMTDHHILAWGNAPPQENNWVERGKIGQQAQNTNGPNSSERYFYGQQHFYSMQQGFRSMSIRGTSPTALVPGCNNYPPYASDVLQPATVNEVPKPSAPFNSPQMEAKFSISSSYSSSVFSPTPSEVPKRVVIIPAPPHSRLPSVHPHPKFPPESSTLADAQIDPPATSPLASPVAAGDTSTMGEEKKDDGPKEEEEKDGEEECKESIKSKHVAWLDQIEKK